MTVHTTLGDDFVVHSPHRIDTAATIYPIEEQYFEIVDANDFVDDEVAQQQQVGNISEAIAKRMFGNWHAKNSFVPQQRSAE